MVTANLHRISRSTLMCCEGMNPFFEMWSYTSFPWMVVYITSIQTLLVDSCVGIKEKYIAMTSLEDSWVLIKERTSSLWRITKSYGGGKGFLARNVSKNETQPNWASNIWTIYIRCKCVLICKEGWTLGLVARCLTRPEVRPLHPRWLPGGVWPEGPLRRILSIRRWYKITRW